MKNIFCLLFATIIFCSGAFAQNADPKAATDAVNQLSITLYKQLSQKDGNLFFSPYSISDALAMTYAGANADTAAQMAKVLFFPPEPKSLHASFQVLNNGLETVQKKGDVAFNVANSLWAEQDFDFKDDFLNVTKEYYKSELNKVDFKTQSDLVRGTINAWVEKNTNGRIKDLIAPGVLDEYTRLVLVNAIYFKGQWQEEFKKEETKPQPFYLAPDKPVQVELMYREANLKYAEDDVCQILELPYKGNDLSMVVFLPQEKDGLKALENIFTYEYVSLFQLQMPEQKVRVYLPKFKLETQFMLSGALKAMGMDLAFDRDKADFSGVANLTPDQKLFISEVIHKVFIEVNEEGTEAAAATAVVMETGMAASTPPSTKVFRADHPFIFLIKDNKTGAILFLGRYAGPEAKK